MGRKTKNKTLNVLLNGLLVGYLKKESSGLISFQYEDKWLSNGFAISNSLPLQEDEYKGEVVSRYFDNLLPDNDDIKKIIATKFGAESIRSFDILEVIGKDCVGALSFLKMGQEVLDPFQMNYSPISKKEIAYRLRNLGSTTPLGMDTGDFRISVAGAQEKTAFLKIDGKWYEPHGLTPTTHILKTSIGALGEDVNFDDSIDNELVSLLIMRKMGLHSCKANIELFENEKVLAVERFDRVWTEYNGKKVLVRRHQEDLCQALNISPYKKYQNEGGPGLIEITKLLMASKENSDRINFFKAIIVFDLLYATDGHAKNFSIFLERDGFKLTPFYDVMGAYFLFKREKRPIQKLKLAMNIGNSGHYKFSKISKKHYEESAKLCGINKNVFEMILSDLKDKYDKLSFTKNELDSHLNHTTLEIIQEGIKKRASILFH